MAKRRAPKRKSEAISAEQKENTVKVNSAENGVTDSSSTPKNKKKKSATIRKSVTQNESSAKKKKTKTKPSDKSDEDEEDYEVDKILDIKYKSNNKREFLIRWKNYSSKHDTWEPEENLSCDDLINEFLQLQEKKEKSRKELRKRHLTTVTAAEGRKSKRNSGKQKNYTEEEEDN